MDRLVDTVEEMISFLAVETGDEDLVVLGVAMLDGAGTIVVYMTATTIWMGVVVVGLGAGLITEETLQIGVEAEVTVLALKRSAHGVIVEAVAEVEVGAGVEAGPAAAVLDVAVVVEAAAAPDVAAVAVAVEARVMTDMRSQMTNILIRRILHSLNPMFLLNQQCLRCHQQALRHFHPRNLKEVTLWHVPQW